MDINYFKKEEVVRFFFSRDEIGKAYFFLKIAIKRQSEKGNPTPSLVDLEEILDQIDSKTEKTCLEFYEENKDLCVEFIMAMIEFSKKENIDTSPLNKLLFSINFSPSSFENTLH